MLCIYVYVLYYAYDRTIYKVMNSNSCTHQNPYRQYLYIVRIMLPVSIYGESAHAMYIYGTIKYDQSMR